LVLGDVTTPEPVLVRVQMASLMRDIFTLETQPDNVPTTEWMRQLEQEGRGVLLYILPRSSCTLTHSWMGGQPSKDDGHGLPLRDIGIGSQILVRLGIKSIRLLTNNPRRLAGIEGYGIHVVDCIPSGATPSKDRKAE
jgi:3,4-dihydroxy 2-butanone 4-phosphate synthase/GTP cyclohydrolase II